MFQKTRILFSWGSRGMPYDEFMLVEDPGGAVRTSALLMSIDDDPHGILSFTDDVVLHGG